MLCMHEHETVPLFQLLVQRCEESPNMSKANRAVTKRIIKHVKITMESGHDLLLLAVRRWALAYNKSADMVIKANQELIELAPEEVLINPAGFLGPYHAAKLKFEKRESAIAAAAIAAAVVAAAVVEDSDDESLDADTAYVPLTIKAEPSVSHSLSSPLRALHQGNIC